MDRKRGPDNEQESGPRKEARSGTIIKMLCPYYSAGAIIGDQGKEIKTIKDNLGVAIQVSKKDVRFPKTDERVITLQGDSETLKKAIKHIQTLIRNDKPPPSARNVDLEANDKRKRALKLVVADTSAGRIIGKGGENIKALKEKYTVVVNTSKKNELPEGLDERIVSIEGEKEEVDNCFSEIVENICNDDKAKMAWRIDYNNLSCGYDDRGYYRGGYGASNRGPPQSQYDGYSGRSGYGGGYHGYDSRGYGSYGGYGGGSDYDPYSRYGGRR